LSLDEGQFGVEDWLESCITPSSQADIEPDGEQRGPVCHASQNRIENQVEEPR
jgi:hypothetical protein